MFKEIEPFAITDPITGVTEKPAHLWTDVHFYSVHLWVQQQIYSYEGALLLLDWLSRATGRCAVPEGWKPTAENINALPKPLRDYIHALETACDPAGTIRENVLVQEENQMLRAMLAAPPLPARQGTG